jgi:phosphinothricin acetyltransferase
MTAPLAVVTIRPAADADMDAIAAIYAHHVLHGRASFETEPPSPAEMRRRRADVVGKRLPYLVAEQAGTAVAAAGAAAGDVALAAAGDVAGAVTAGVAAEMAGAMAGEVTRKAAAEVVGYAYAGPYRPRAAYANTVENSVYLRPDAIGRGVGRALLAALVTACEARGLRQMVAVVGDSANLASIRLHESLGFRQVGVLRDVGYKHGVWLDSVLLQRSLGVGNAVPPHGCTDG